MMIISLITSSAYNGEDGLFTTRPSVVRMMVRLITCYMFHMGNYRDVSDSFRRLKFLKHNPSKFVKNYFLAAFVTTQF